MAVVGNVSMLEINGEGKQKKMQIDVDVRLGAARKRQGHQFATGSFLVLQ